MSDMCAMNYQCRRCGTVVTPDDLRKAKIAGIKGCNIKECSCGCRCFITWSNYNEK